MYKNRQVMPDALFVYKLGLIFYVRNGYMESCQNTDNFFKCLNIFYNSATSSKIEHGL